MLHWIADRGAAVGTMTRALRPGGVLALVAPGPGHDREYVDVLRAVRPRVPQQMIDVFDAAQVFPDALNEHLRAAGMVPLDMWVETRPRRVPPEAYMERIVAVGSHLWSHLPLDEQEAMLARIRAGLAAVSREAGFAYTFTKTFAVARRPV
jgi:SAM-dependent methyltransferase